jgi:predicted Zn finger-like uncharacterized protein
VIVICEHCETRFKLDETRIPPGGARVRCSRCKHAFFLPAPGGDEPDLLDELISQTAAEPLRAPHPTEDLSGGFPLSEPTAPEPPTQEPLVEGPPSAPAREIEASESEWEFSDDFPRDDAADESMDLSSDRLELDDDASGSPAEESGLELEAAPEASRPAAPPPASRPEIPPGPEPASGLGFEPQAEEGELNWDFEDEDLGEPATQPDVPPAPTRAPARMPLPAPVGLEALASTAPSELLEAPEGVGRLLEAAGWLATVIFAGLVTVQLLLSATPAGPVTVSKLDVGPLVAESLRGRFVENLFVGPLLVVTADLYNPGTEPSSLGAVLRAVLLDAEGSPVAGSKAALAPAAERELREQPPEVLAARLADRAQGLSEEVLAPGARLGVTAVFPGAAAEASGLTLEMGPRTAATRLQAGAADRLEPLGEPPGGRAEAVPVGGGRSPPAEATPMGGGRP